MGLSKDGDVETFRRRRECELSLGNGKAIGLVGCWSERERGKKKTTIQYAGNQYLVNLVIGKTMVFLLCVLGCLGGSV